MNERHYRLDPEHHLLELMQTSLRRINRQSINVQLVRDSVLLTGNVGSWHEKQHAQECVRPYSQGRSISNHIRVEA